MHYDLIQLDTAAPKVADARILIVYTGGTFGMGNNQEGNLAPFDFKEILSEIPTLKAFDLIINVLSFHTPIDSSNITPDHWTQLNDILCDHYEDYDGFVILHGTDTMAYTASALSYTLEGLGKPVIFTGAQLPIASPRTDARENLITAIEIASARSKNKPLVPEVCIFFNNILIRGNRAKKVESMHFDAFESENYPELARSGVTIVYNEPYIIKQQEKKLLKQSPVWDTNVAYLKLFPGINELSMEGILGISGLKAVVLETYGSGNAPTSQWFIDIIDKFIRKGIIIFNVSQCLGGRVIQGKYETSIALKEIGVIEGLDITSEAAITKLMYLLGNHEDLEKVKKLLAIPLRGEMAL